ncbi:MAG TPA: RNA polymerase sigma factor [Polyangiaceae bacterium]|nr:RNA polymerase sigma factor [Polyangiaceae bacterium]
MGRSRAFRARGSASVAEAVVAAAAGPGANGEAAAAGADAPLGERGVALLREALWGLRQGQGGATPGGGAPSWAGPSTAGLGLSGQQPGLARGPASAVFERVEEHARDLIARGDHGAALTLLMEAHGEAVYSFCLQIVKDAAGAEDLRQRVFLQAYEGLSGFTGASTLRTWLLSIAKYRSLDALRAARRESGTFVIDDGLSAETADGSPDLPESAALAQALAVLRACLEGRLSAGDRRLLMMRYRDGLSYEEMAAALGSKPDTLRARVTRTLPKLRRWLQRSGVEF